MSQLDRPDFGVVRVYEHGDAEGHKVVVVDTEKAKYRGRPWLTLKRFFRRKFENLVVLSEPTERIRVFYDLPDGRTCYDSESAANAYYYRFGY